MFTAEPSWPRAVERFDRPVQSPTAQGAATGAPQLPQAAGALEKHWGRGRRDRREGRRERSRPKVSPCPSLGEAVALLGCVWGFSGVTAITAHECTRASCSVLRRLWKQRRPVYLTSPHSQYLPTSRVPLTSIIQRWLF